MENRIFISTCYNEKGCVLCDDVLYGFDNTMLKCLDLEGNELWRERGLGKGALIASDERLIVVSEKGELLVAEASREGFEVLARTQIFNGEGVCWTMPVLAEGRIYLRDSLGRLVCRDHRPTSE